MKNQNMTIYEKSNNKLNKINIKNIFNEKTTTIFFIFINKRGF